MKMLFLCHRIPYPPNKGDKLRAFNIIKHLSKKHDITLVALYDFREDRKYSGELEDLCTGGIHLFYLNPVLSRIRSLFCLISNRPVTLGHFYSRKMASAVDRITGQEEFDLVFAYSSSVAQYVMDLGTRKIMDFVDCDSSKWGQYSKMSKFPLSVIYRREDALLREYEKKVCSAFDQMIVVTEREKKEFASFVSTDRFLVIENGVDTDVFSPGERSWARNRLVFTGVMDYYANIEGVRYFCGEIFPLIRKEVPDAEFYIVGSNPAREVRALARMEGVFVTGYVDDVRDYFNEASVCVIPLRIARGVQNKVLEAMASGLPVVTTSAAFSGIGAEAGRDILVADEPEDFSGKVVSLLKDKAAGKRIGQAARKYTEMTHSWEKNLTGIDGLLSG